MKYAKLFAVLGLVALAGAGSSTLLDVFGTVNGTVEVERPLEIDEIYYESNVSDQSSGEYVVLEVNADSVKGDDFGLKVSDSTDLYGTGQFSEGNSVVFYENDSEDNFQVLKKKDDYEYVEIDDFSLTDSGQYVNLTYEPENAQIQSVKYEGDCDSSQSYFVWKSDEEDPCQDASHEVLGDTQ